MLNIGFQEERFLLRPNVNPNWVIVDCIFLIPALVDGITGAWNDLDRTKIWTELKESP